MCTTNDDQVNTSSSLSGSDVNVKIKKHHKQLPHNAKSTLCSNETHSVDLQIHTNVEFVSNKKIKLCMLINILITLVSISGSATVVYNIHTELISVQNQVLLLNEKLLTLSKLHEHMKNNVADVRNNVAGVKENMPNVRKDAPDVNGELQEEAVTQPLLNKKEKLDMNYLIELNTSIPYRNRLRRANKKNRQTIHRKVKSSGALAVHFKGSLPEIHIRDQGLIGPWYPDNFVSGQYKFPKFHLTEGKYSIEVTEPALYLIYAQVYYITSSALNSYSVYVRSEGSSENVIIARCSTIGPNNSHVAEISCYTAAIYSLKSNDRIFLQQTEKNRTIILRDGHSFFGVVRLNNSIRNKS